MAVHRAALVVLVVILCSIGFDNLCSISSVAAATGSTQGPISPLYEQKDHVLTSLRSAGYHRVAAFLELSNVLRALPQNATLFAPSDKAIATIVFSPAFNTLLLYHFAAHRFSFADLLVLPQGTRIGTFLPGRSILVTSGLGLTRVSIDGVAVVFPDIYQDGTLCVHGVAASLDPDRFGMAQNQDLLPLLNAPARNSGFVLAPSLSPVSETLDPAEVGSQPASSSAPSVTSSMDNVQAEAPTHERALAPSFSPTTSYYKLDFEGRSSHQGRRSSNEVSVGGANLVRGGPVASDARTYDLTSRGSGLAPLGRQAERQSMHAHNWNRSRLSSSSPSSSPVSSSRISSSPSPDPHQRSSTYRGTGTRPSPDNAAEDPSRRNSAGASPSSASSPRSGRLSSPYSPSTRISTPSESPHNYVVANRYLVASDQASYPPYGSPRPANATERTWASPSSPPRPTTARGSRPRPAGRIPASSPASASTYNFTAASPGFANAADNMRPATPFLSGLRPMTPSRAPATGSSRPPLSASPPADFGSRPAPSNADLRENSTSALQSLRVPIA